MTRAELEFEIMGYINYLMIDGKENTDMSTVMDTSKLSEYHGFNIERLCQELAYHIKEETRNE